MKVLLRTDPRKNLSFQQWAYGSVFVQFIWRALVDLPYNKGTTLPSYEQTFCSEVAANKVMRKGVTGEIAYING